MICSTRFWGIAILAGMVARSADAGDVENVRHVAVFHEPGRFGGWPANHGIWSWGNEILVGFSRGYYKDLGPDRHAIDRDKPEEHLLARSLDGGLTWSIEDPSRQGALIPRGKSLHGKPPVGRQEADWTDCPGDIEFTHPDFALTLRMTDTNVGPSCFYYSYDRGHSWKGPFRFPDLGTPGIAARTDYLVEGPRSCLVFLTAAKSNGKEGRPLCARTTDGGKTWNVHGWIAPEQPGYAIMPATVRLSDSGLFSAIRHRDGTGSWIDGYRSMDNGQSWSFVNRPVPDTGEGNPASLIRLKDGRLCLIWGQRKLPFSIHAKLSSDQGSTWSRDYLLRTDGKSRDIGYPRSIQRPDGTVVVVYYFCEDHSRERDIIATLWSPPAR
ncbi:MAG: exo-alpha-sialidase [Planctomycetes bacterium]|nr:exo-alpha-sialidase [Planctomycetota bacterium]